MGVDRQSRRSPEARNVRYAQMRQSAMRQSEPSDARNGGGQLGGHGVQGSRGKWFAARNAHEAGIEAIGGSQRRAVASRSTIARREPRRIEIDGGADKGDQIETSEVRQGRRISG